MTDDANGFGLEEIWAFKLRSQWVQIISQKSLRFSLTQSWGWHNASFPGPCWDLAQALYTPETTGGLDRFPAAHEPPWEVCTYPVCCRAGQGVTSFAYSAEGFSRCTRPWDAHSPFPWHPRDGMRNGKKQTLALLSVPAPPAALAVGRRRLLLSVSTSTYSSLLKGGMTVSEFLHEGISIAF